MEKTLAAKVYEAVKDDIGNLRYGGNEFLSEQRIADKYGVSKATAREALAMLSQEGYLVKYPNRGYVVKSICLKEYQDITQLRLLIEVGALDYSIQNATDDQVRHVYSVLDRVPATHENFHELNRAFHYEMAKLSGNDKLADTVRELIRTVSRPIAYRNFGRDAGELQQAHREIVDALMRRDAAQAKFLMRQDIIPVTGVPKDLFDARVRKPFGIIKS